MLRQFAATSLAELGDDDNMVERRLLKIVQDDGVDPDIRGQAIFTLGKVGSERSRTTVDRLSTRPNTSGQDEACAAISSSVAADESAGGLRRGGAYTRAIAGEPMSDGEHPWSIRSRCSYQIVSDGRQRDDTSGSRSVLLSNK